MIISKCLSILIMAYLAINVAADPVQIKVRPITREQYDNILKLNDGKPVIPEGRLINSAISGLTGLAAGFQLSKILPNLFGSTHKVKLDGYPLCTIKTDDIAGRQLEEPSYVNVDELANSLARPDNGSNHGTLMNCILVLDDGKPSATTERPSTTTTTTPMPQSSTTTTKKPIRPHYPHPPHYYPPYLPLYPPYYSYYPYPPPPPHYHPKPEQDPEQDEPVDLHSLIINKIESITGATTTTTTTKKPTQKTRRRPHNRYPPQPYPGFPSNYPEFNPMQTTSRRRQPPQQDLDEYDDSVDYIEVSKKSKHHF